MKVGGRAVFFGGSEGLSAFAVDVSESGAYYGPSVIADRPARCALESPLKYFPLRLEHGDSLHCPATCSRAFAAQSPSQPFSGNRSSRGAETVHHHVQRVEQYLAVPNHREGTSRIAQGCVLAFVYRVSEYWAEQAQCCACFLQLLAGDVDTLIG